MINAGKKEIKDGPEKDGWTIVTKDHSLSAQWEHTILVTRTGYEVQVLPAWTDVPSDDLQADTALMNQRLAAYISTMPEQYYWVHKRFKDRPPGMPSVY
jgi:hypothetical protein